MRRLHVQCQVAVVAVVVGLVGSSVFAQQKLAQTGFQFLSVGTDARATAMGEAFNTIEGSPTALFYNPAGMARLNSFFQIAVNQTTWIADINYFSGSFAINPDHGKYGVIGISFLFVDYGDIMGTVVAENEQGFIETGTFSPGAVMVGLGYARALTDRFSVGGHLKYVRQDLGTPRRPGADNALIPEDLALDVLAFDFGTIYKTGFKSLNFGMSLRNFSQEITYIREGFQLPLTFKIGFSIDALDFFQSGERNQSFLVSFDAVNPRAFSEFFSVGGEYVLMDALALRAGYIHNQDDYSITAGFGLKVYKIMLDYSYTPFQIFDDVHRVSAKLSF